MRPNVFSGGTLDRASTLRRDEARLTALLKESSSRFLPVWRNSSLINGGEIVTLSAGQLPE